MVLVSMSVTLTMQMVVFFSYVMDVVVLVSVDVGMLVTVVGNVGMSSWVLSFMAEIILLNWILP